VVPGLFERERQGGKVPKGEMADDENPTHGDALQEQMDAFGRRTVVPMAMQQWRATWKRFSR
jgi:hypothetical protein